MRSTPSSPPPPVPSTHAGLPPRASAQRRISSWSVVVCEPPLPPRVVPREEDPARPRDVLVARLPPEREEDDPLPPRPPPPPPRRELVVPLRPPALVDRLPPLGCRIWPDM